MTAHDDSSNDSINDSVYGRDIFTEPEPDPDTLANLGPLAPLAGIWESATGTDVHPVAEGAEQNVFVERYELQPIDAQTNGPQLFYGLRYHTHIVKPGEVETFHDQIGYWLWEPATTRSRLHARPSRVDRCCSPGAPAEPDATDLRGERGGRLRDVTASCRTRSSTRRFARSATAWSSRCTTTARGRTPKRRNSSFPVAANRSVTPTATR